MNNKLLLLTLFFVMISCIDPKLEEEIQNCKVGEVCDNQLQSGDDTPIGGNPSSDDPTTSSEDVPPPPPPPVYSCVGKSYDFATLCEGDGDDLSIETSFSLAEACGENKCEFVCNEDYQVNAEKTACEKIVIPPPPPPPVYNCTGASVDFAKLCVGDADNLTVNTMFSLVDKCGDNKCELVCLDGYRLTQDKAGCEAIPEIPPPPPPVYTCDGSSYPFAKLCEGDADDLTKTVSFSLVEACSTDVKCEYICQDGYKINEAKNGCEEIIVVPPPPPPVYNCQGSSVPFSKLCDGDADELIAVTNFSLVPACTLVTKCEVICIPGYQINADKNACEQIIAPPEPAPFTLGVKNYSQLNNTYSSLTGIATNEPSVLAEFEAIVMQLPTSNDPQSLNGFNQIAQVRLGHAYCSAYMDKNYASQYSSLTNSQIVDKLLNQFGDVDLANNPYHQALKQNMLDIMNDVDGLVNDSNTQRERLSLTKMTCAALLASSYVTLQ